jgi:hypothetical protein
MPARTTQDPKVCSAECRRARRNRRARERRRRRADAAREDERDRQRRSRARRREEAMVTCTSGQVPLLWSVDLGALEATCDGRVSRAGFAADLLEIIEKSLKILEESQRLSRATFEAQTRRILGVLASEVGVSWQSSARCHVPASPPNTS